VVLRGEFKRQPCWCYRSEDIANRIPYNRVVFIPSLIKFH